MGKLIRFYNQNVRKVWTIVLIIVFALMIISAFNSMYKKRSEDRNKEIQSGEYIQKYHNESESMVSGGYVPDSVREDFGDLIDSFFNYCKNHEPEKAYGLISNDCKQLLYPTEEVFEEQYYKNKFKADKLYSFQSWTASDTYIYLVKIFDNMLATGSGSSQEYIQDYVSVVKENGEYKLNINSYIGRVSIAKKYSKDGLTIEVLDRYIFMDYGIYSLKIQNNSGSTVLLDSMEETNKTYVVDEDNIKSEAMLYENTKDDLTIIPNTEKEIQIKFSDVYQEKNMIEKMVFEDVRVDLDMKMKIEIDIR